MNLRISPHFFLPFVLISTLMACGPSDDTEVAELDTKESRIDFCEELADIELKCPLTVMIDGKEQTAQEDRNAIVDVEECSSQLVSLPDDPSVTVGEIRKCAETQIPCGEPSSITKNFLLIDCFPALKE